MELEIRHFGVKGMQWGVRKDNRKKNREKRRDTRRNLSVKTKRKGFRLSPGKTRYNIGNAGVRRLQRDSDRARAFRKKNNETFRNRTKEGKIAIMATRTAVVLGGMSVATLARNKVHPIGVAAITAGILNSDLPGMH